MKAATAERTRSERERRERRRAEKEWAKLNEQASRAQGLTKVRSGAALVAPPPPPPLPDEPPARQLVQAADWVAPPPVPSSGWGKPPPAPSGWGPPLPSAQASAPAAAATEPPPPPPPDVKPGAAVGGKPLAFGGGMKLGAPARGGNVLSAFGNKRTLKPAMAAFQLDSDEEG